MSGENKASQKAVEHARETKREGNAPAAGPHAKEKLTNPDATPGAGSLPDERASHDVDGGAG